MLQRFLDYSDRLTKSLSARAEVIGLVLVGSTADTSRVDEWSDHDFFVVTRAGEAEAMRQDLSWVPDSEQIAFAPRETAHGLKVIFEDGRVLEFAVFNDEELELAGANAYAVAIDKSNIAERMKAIAERSVPKPIDVDVDVKLFLSQVLIGVGRARRGEVLIAGQQIRSWALEKAVGLLRQWVAPRAGTESKEDNLSRFRRFELQYPELGAELESLLQQPVEAAARGLMHLVQTHGEGHLTEEQLHGFYVVRHRLEWV